MYEDFLQKIPLFSQLPREDLARLCSMVEEVPLVAGEELFAEGSPGDRAYVLKEGQIEIIKQSGQRELLLQIHEKPGEVIGEMALIEQAPRMASVRARTDSFLLAIHHEQLDDLLNNSPSAARAMLETVITRWRNTEALLRQSEKLAQLGTLTAGVAHELNNPAAAVRRGADQLQETIHAFGLAQAAYRTADFSAEQQRVLDEFNEIIVARSLEPVELDGLARSDLEYDIEEWLEDQGMDEAWEVAPTLVNLSFDQNKLDDTAAVFKKEQIPVVANWLHATFSVYSLLAEIGQGASRISEIVKALKSYAYLDQAPVQPVNIHEGLNDTLIMLRNKLKQGIVVHRNYARDLPIINGYGSELNQLWTNLIDNAADAMDGQGEITIRTYPREDGVAIEITDTGPGIPQEIANKIFDPFFTTKPPGKGTGLGLSISYNIVTQKHRGDIKVKSDANGTTFQVWLPVDFTAH